MTPGLTGGLKYVGKMFKNHLLKNDNATIWEPTSTMQVF